MKRIGLCIAALLAFTCPVYPQGNPQLPQTQGWFSIPNTTIRPLCPTYAEIQATQGCPAVMTNWSGALWDWQRSRFVITGGGHTGYYGNEIYAIDFSTNPISRVLVHDATHNPNLTAPAGCSDANADGTPDAAHNYNGLNYLGDLDFYSRYSGSLASCGSFSNAMWNYDPVANTWAQVTTTGAGPNPASNGSLPYLVYNPSDFKSYYVEANFGPTFRAFNTVTKAWSSLSGTSACPSLNMMQQDDPIRRIFICIGAGTVGKKVLMDSPFTTTTLALTGCSITNGAPGFIYNAAHRDFEIFDVGASGGNTVQFYNPDTDSCTSATFTGGPTTGSPQGAWGRYRYDAADGISIYCGSIDENCFAFRRDTVATLQALDWTNRSTASGVIIARGWDSSSEFALAGTTWGTGVHVSANGLGTVPVQDTTTYTSGGSSIKYTIPGQGGADNTGAFFQDIPQNFAQNSHFYIQYRMKVDSNCPNSGLTGSCLVDQNPTNTWFKQSIFAWQGSTCAEIELTTIDDVGNHYPGMYTHCGTPNFQVSIGSSDFLNEQGENSVALGAAQDTGYNCHYQKANNTTPRNCAFYPAGVWVTYYYDVSIGTYNSNNSHVNAYRALPGQPYRQFVNYTYTQLAPSDGSPGYNLVDLIPYFTSRNNTVCYVVPNYTCATSTGNMWYDELIVSTAPIAAPMAPVTNIAPTPTLITSTAVPIAVPSSGSATWPTPCTTTAACYRVTLPEKSIAGATLVMAFGYDSTGANQVFSVTDDKSNTWVLDATSPASNNKTLRMFRATNVAAGTSYVNVQLTSGTQNGYWDAQIGEFFNAGGLDVASCSTGSSATISAGSLTPTQSGDLIFQAKYTANTLSTTAPFNMPVQTASFTAGSQANITWNLLSQLLGDGAATQYGVYNSTAALNPTFTQAASDNYISCAVALLSVSSGSASTASPRILHKQDDAMPKVAPNPWTVGLVVDQPNTAVYLSYVGNDSLTSVASVPAPNVGWTASGADFNGLNGHNHVNFYCAKWTTPPGSVLLNLTRSANTNDSINMVYVVVGGTCNLDVDSGGQAANQTTQVSTLTTCSSCLTPTAANDFILINGGQLNCTATSLNAPATGIFDAAWFSGNTIDGPTQSDENNQFAHYYNGTSLSPITITYNYNCGPSAQDFWAARAAAYKSATVTASTPTFSPGAGTYSSTQSVTINNPSGTPVICFTTNGATPATNGTTGCTTGTIFTTPVSVSVSETINAVAGGTGFSDSSVGSAAYVIGAPVASFSPNPLTFNGIKLGLSSAALPITLQNTGSITMSISSIALTGANIGDFSQTNTCGATLAANATCTINVTFTPLASGSRSASVSVTSNTLTSPDTDSLSGLGFYPITGTGTISGTGTIKVQP